MTPTEIVARALAGRYYDMTADRLVSLGVDTLHLPISRAEFVERRWKRWHDDAATAVQALMAAPATRCAA